MNTDTGNQNCNKSIQNSMECIKYRTSELEDKVSKNIPRMSIS